MAAICNNVLHLSLSLTVVLPEPSGRAAEEQLGQLLREPQPQGLEVRLLLAELQEEEEELASQLGLEVEVEVLRLAELLLVEEMQNLFLAFL